MRKNDILARKEHEAIRNKVGYYDFTHKLLKVTGPDAEKFLDKIFVAAVSKAKVGEAKYSTMLNEDGIIIDDVIIFHISTEIYWVSTLYIDEMIAWFNAHKAEENVSYEEITKVTTMYAVQGPNSRILLDDILDTNIDNLKYFHIEDNKIDSINVKIARSGYTGELGYEIYCSPEDAAFIESELEKQGKPYGIQKITTDVIVTSLPREKGFVLMSDLAGTNPLEVGFSWTIDWNKDFIGKPALLKVKEKGAIRSLIGFTVDDDTADIAPGAAIKVDEKPCGKVTMFTYGFTVEKNIGFALIDKAVAKPGDSATILSDGKEIPTMLTDRVFYDPKNTRVRGLA
ncbi:MAG: aminomethyltransferase family protein [Clostridiales bacterium]|nr:aminomethyltransferase family protein [Clostridiales bacterium]